MINLKELREKALKATAGQWGAIYTADRSAVKCWAVGPRHSWPFDREQASADAAHIAAFSPAIALLLLDQLEEYEAALLEVKALSDADSDTAASIATRALTKFKKGKK